MPPQINCASVLPGKMEKHENCIFLSALPEFNQSLLDFFNPFDLPLILRLLYDSLNLVISVFSSQLLGGMVQEKRSREHLSSWTVLHSQCTSALSSGFHLSQGNAKALDSWGEETKHRLISHFLSNTSAKNYHDQIVNVKIIASQRWDVFWDTLLQDFVPYSAFPSRPPIKHAIHRKTKKMVVMATSLKCKVLAISAFCRPTTQPPQNQLPSR